MDIRRLSLPQRSALAVLSGALTYPAFRIDSMLGPESYPPVFSWWLILHGLTFGLLVMAPFVTANGNRALRAFALTISGVLIYDVAIRAPDLVELETLGELGDFAIAGLTGAVLVAIAVRFLAPLTVTAAYWLLTAAAGFLGGLIFSQTFDLCNLDRCRSVAWVLPYVSGWIAWQSLVCAAVYLGTRRPSPDGFDQGASTR